MTLAVWWMLGALLASFLAGFILWTENRRISRKNSQLEERNKRMSTTLDRLQAVIPQLEADVTALEAKLAAAEASTGTPDAVLDPLVSRLEALHTSMAPTVTPPPTP